MSEFLRRVIRVLIDIDEIRDPEEHEITHMSYFFPQLRFSLKVHEAGGGKVSTLNHHVDYWLTLYPNGV